MKSPSNHINALVKVHNIVFQSYPLCSIDANPVTFNKVESTQDGFLLKLEFRWVAVRER